MTTISGRSNRSYDPPRFMEYFFIGEEERLAPVVTTVLGQTILPRWSLLEKSCATRHARIFTFNR